MDAMDAYDLDRRASGRGSLDALAHAELLSGDPVLDRRFAVLADADPLGLRIPRRAAGCDAAWMGDTASPERQAYRIPMPAGPAPAWWEETDA
jgi:hypothetical protein